MSIQKLAYNAKANWTNNTVSDDTVNIGGTDSAWYTDAFNGDQYTFRQVTNLAPNSRATA